MQTLTTKQGIKVPMVTIDGVRYVTMHNMVAVIDNLSKPNIDRQLLEQVLEDLGCPGVLNMLRRGIFDL